MKKLNKKGFTLVELLSVIVILSVVVLIATNAVVPMMGSARKDVFAGEANTFLKTAKAMYVNEKASGNKCYTYEEVINSGLIDKNDESYQGSFLIEEKNGHYSYKIWLSNGKNLIDGATPDVSREDVSDSSNEASKVCGAE